MEEPAAQFPPNHLLAPSGLRLVTAKLSNSSFVGSKIMGTFSILNV
ncbi:MAG: hypothetical protein HYW48_08100 [Deltaproteobacteria bacterium]|nr:hypothetical protein [Deltaproteobacteria bacterium]